MNKKIIMAALLGAAFSIGSAQEISAFDAGNMDSANPYGLTDDEKATLSNKRSVQNIEENMARMNKLEQRMNDIETKVNGGISDSGVSLTSLKAYVDETRDIQDKNYKNITAALNKLGAIMDKNAAQPKQNANPKQQNKPTSNFSGKSDKDILADGVKLLNSGNSTEAAEYFEYLNKKGYKTGASNYYLGEVAYSQKSYSTAIQYYKKSIQSEDKADYTPKLLYHTAISFDKIGDTQSANRFYKALKVGYPDSKEAKASPNRN